MPSLWKKFEKPSLEDTFRASPEPSELIIDEPDEVKLEEVVEEKIEQKQESTKENKKQRKKKPKKKKKETATTIHLKIKKIIEDSPDLGGHKLARSVLKKAVKNGFKGKRLSKWSAYFEDYFKSVEEQEIVMGSTVKSMRERKEVLPKNKKSSTIQKVQEEKEEMVEIPDLPLDEFDEDIEVQDASIEDESGGAVVFGIIGAGQAGGRLAESFYKLGYKKVLAVNTTEKDLDGLADLPEKQKVVMATEDGGGAGKDMAKGEAAADKHQQEIYEKMQTLFGKVDRVLVCAGGGGGTGGGSCLRLVETARKYLQYLGVPKAKKKVGVILTLPTAGEAASPQVAKNAHRIASHLLGWAETGQISPFIIFDNDKIKKLYGKRLAPRQYWPTVNATVTGLFHMFNVLSAQSSDLTSFDPADYSKVLSAAGCMIMGMTTLKEYQDGTDVSRAIRGNLEKGLLCGGFDISTAKAAACIATAPAVVLDNTPGLMDSFETGFDTLANITGNATVFRGIYEVDKDKVVVYTMLTGLDSPQKRLKELMKFEEDKTEKAKLF